MAREFHTDVDLKGALLLNGSAGTPGQIPYSAGPGAPLTWGNAPSGGGGVTAGDKGDITIDASGNWSIDSGAVTYAKIQNVSATDRILGRSSSGAGVVEEIVCTAAARSLLDDSTSAEQRQTLGIGLSGIAGSLIY